MSRWRDRIGEEGAEWLLTKTIEAGRAAGTVTDANLKRVVMYTTVMEKAIAHPTDAKLYEKARSKPVALAREGSMQLCQSYARKAPRLAVQVGLYAHARQFKRMRKALRTLKGYTGRVLRDIRRQIDGIAKGGVLRTRSRHAGAGLTAVALDAEVQGQDLRAARAGGRLHLQGQGTGPLRVRHQGQHCLHHRREVRGGRAGHARQPL